MQDSLRRKLQKKHAVTRSTSPLIGRRFLLPGGKKRLTLKEQIHLAKFTLNPKTKMIDKLKKTELWIAVLSTAAITLLTQLGLDPELAAKIIGGIGMTYIGGRSIAKAGQDSTN